MKDGTVTNLSILHSIYILNIEKIELYFFIEFLLYMKSCEW